ncbi:GNAT family N-acetyltransferase [Streptomyces sp. NPDC020898]|uniref:GNAT family N-acetyltransferase n=1 Tax=Streptomyces sp. NPDC020898 TaxID=3365101 RepID=UPI0037AB86E8
MCRDEGIKVWVAEIGTQPVGFVAVAFHDDPRSAEIDMIAVDPDQQCRGVGSALLAFALDRISAAGIHLAHLGTGGDPGHAAARAPTRRPDSRRCHSFTTTRNCLRSAPTDADRRAPHRGSVLAERDDASTIRSSHQVHRI